MGQQPAHRRRRRGAGRRGAARAVEGGPRRQCRQSAGTRPFVWWAGHRPTPGSGMPRSAPAGTFPRRVTSLGGDLRAWKPRFVSGYAIGWPRSDARSSRCLLISRRGQGAGVNGPVPGDRRQARRHRPTSTTTSVQHITYCYGPSRDPGAEHHQIPAGDRRQRAKALAPAGRLHHPLRPRAGLRRRNGPSGRRPAFAPRGLGGQRQPAVRGRGGEDGPAAAPGVRLAQRHPSPTAGSSTTCCTTSSPSRPGLRRLADRLRPDSSSAAAR